jgi:hypothetical protein
MGTSPRGFPPAAQPNPLGTGQQPAQQGESAWAKAAGGEENLFSGLVGRDALAALLAKRQGGVR